ncbi:MAG: PaaI family thioesterase [Bacteroidales bacterium]|nr:PaaI family thioesterase [Bacteroidales bacterium]
MLHKIKNPYTEVTDYNCFGCSPNNPIGLHLEFYDDGENVITKYTPNRNYQGWKNVLHGGIQSLIIDEISSWVVMRRLQTSGVTSKLNIQFKKPALISEGPFTIKAKLSRQMKNIAFIDAEIYNVKNELTSLGTAVYYCWSAEDAKKNFNFEGCFLEEPENESKTN